VAIKTMVMATSRSSRRFFIVFSSVIRRQQLHTHNRQRQLAATEVELAKIKEV
jgi:hypothetical protein